MALLVPPPDLISVPELLKFSAPPRPPPIEPPFCRSKVLELLNTAPLPMNRLTVPLIVPGTVLFRMRPLLMATLFGVMVIPPSGLVCAAPVCVPPLQLNGAVMLTLSVPPTVPPVCVKLGSVTSAPVVNVTVPLKVNGVVSEEPALKFTVDAMLVLPAPVTAVPPFRFCVPPLNDNSAPPLTLNGPELVVVLFSTSVPPVILTVPVWLNTD